MKAYQFRNYKTRHGLTAKQITKMTGCGMRSVWRWLNIGTPDVIDRVLGVNPDDYEHL